MVFLDDPFYCYTQVLSMKYLPLPTPFAPTGTEYQILSPHFAGLPVHYPTFKSRHPLAIPARQLFCSDHDSVFPFLHIRTISICPPRITIQRNLPLLVLSFLFLGPPKDVARLSHQSTYIFEFDNRL